MKIFSLKNSVFTIHNHLILFFIFLIFNLFFTACSSSKEIGKEKEKEDEIYIFDEIPSEDTYKVEEESEPEVDKCYVIQIGAFSTRERAELFAEKSHRDLNRGIDISYNNDVNLFVVRLEEMFNSKVEAERVRANLWQMEEYNDAWIKPLEENPDMN